MKLTGKDVWAWPEWKAFADRLGITEKHIRRCVVTLDMNEVATVNVERIVDGERAVEWGVTTGPAPPPTVPPFGTTWVE